MVRRVCRELGNKQNIVVINDEAHHCYRRKPDGEEEALSGEERREAQKRDEEARVWISGLEAVKDKLGRQARSTTCRPRPSSCGAPGYSEGTLFPWVVSDFSLIDAIESGLVKVPRVPVEDNAMIGDYPVYRHLWPHIRDELPKKGRKTEAVSGEPKLPAKLQGALHSLYNNYQKPITSSGRPTEAASGSARRRCSSWSATTPTSPSCCSTTSPAGRSRSRRAARCWCPARCRSSPTSRTAAGWAGPTPS